MKVAILILNIVTIANANPYLFLLEVGEEGNNTVTEKIRINKSGGSLAVRYPAIGNVEEITHVRVTGMDYGNDLKAVITDGGPGYNYVVIVLTGNAGVAFETQIKIDTLKRDGSLLNNEKDSENSENGDVNEDKELQDSADQDMMVRDRVSDSDTVSNVQESNDSQENSDSIQYEDNLDWKDDTKENNAPEIMSQDEFIQKLKEDYSNVQDYADELDQNSEASSLQDNPEIKRLGDVYEMREQAIDNLNDASEDLDEETDGTSQINKLDTEQNKNTNSQIENDQIQGFEEENSEGIENVKDYEEKQETGKINEYLDFDDSVKLDKESNEPSYIAHQPIADEYADNQLNSVAEQPIGKGYTYDDESNQPIREENFENENNYSQDQNGQPIDQNANKERDYDINWPVSDEDPSYIANRPMEENTKESNQPITDESFDDDPSYIANQPIANQYSDIQDDTENQPPISEEYSEDKPIDNRLYKKYVALKEYLYGRKMKSEENRTYNKNLQIDNLDKNNQNNYFIDANDRYTVDY